MPDFKLIETFLWVVKLGSFHGAAQRLSTTQPAISQRIAQLEREMGVDLLKRGPRATSLTSSGRKMMVYAEKLISLRSEMMAQVAEHTALRGTLRLGASETIVHTWLPHLIKSVNTTYPNLSLEIEVDITPILTARLLAQEIDLAFVLSPLSAPTVRDRVLCDYPISFVTSPALGLGPGPFSVRELAKFPIITFSRNTRPYETVRRLFDRPDLPPIRLHASASLATVIHMVIEGLGIAVVPTAILKNEFRDGRLRELRTDFTLPPLTFCAAWLSSPEEIAIERVANLAAQIAHASMA